MVNGDLLADDEPLPEDVISPVTWVVGPRGFPGKDGKDGAHGQSITGPRGEPGEQGPPGPVPDHEWKKQSLRFEKPDGAWGPWVNLKGDNGYSTVISDGGGQLQGEIDIINQSIVTINNNIADLDNLIDTLQATLTALAETVQIAADAALALSPLDEFDLGPTLTPVTDALNLIVALVNALLDAVQELDTP